MEEETKKEDVVLEPPQPEEMPPPYNPALQGCRNVDEFTHLNKIEEGTDFSKTFRNVIASQTIRSHAISL